MKFSFYPLKQLLSGGALCCLVLLGAYAFQAYFPEFFVGAISSSLYSLMWISLFVGSLIWTFRENYQQGMFTKFVDWQYIAGFLLLLSDQIYALIPKEFSLEVTPMMSAYSIPMLALVGVAMFSLLKVSTALRHKLDTQRQQAELREKKILQLLDAAPKEQQGLVLVCRFLRKEQSANLSPEENQLLQEGFKLIDPFFFVWMEEQGHQLSLREVIYCVLVRMNMTKESIQKVFSLSDGAYRTMKSRVRNHLKIDTSKDMDAFLRNLK